MSYQGARYGSRERADAARNASGKPRSKWNPNWKKKEEVVRGSAYKRIATPSAQQTVIFDHFRSSPTPLVVIARAGTGKTATAVHGMNECIPKGRKTCYMIFANRNAREAESKTFKGIDVSTCHSFGFRVVREALPTVKFEVDAHGEKSRNIAQALLGPEDEKVELRYNFCKALDLAKGALCTTEDEIIDVCDNFEVEYCNMDEHEFAANVLKGLELSAKQYARIEFSDMIWLPWKLGLTIPHYDNVIADECQDLNAARRFLALRAAEEGKLVAIGDDKQAIFGFTGADSGSIQKIIDETGAETLPLTTTYRCGKAIVELAKQYVDDYVAADTNPDGEVVECTGDEMMREHNKGGAGPGDFILSRVNAPLVSMCLQFVKEGRRANVLGKELGKNLQYMLRRSGAVSADGFLMWLDEWQRIETERLQVRNKPSDHIKDKADCLRALCEGTNDLGVVRARIEDMFESEEKVGEGPSRIILSTIHKAKGLEADRVFLLNYTFTFDGPEEDNVRYVAITRARTHLFMLNA